MEHSAKMRGRKYALIIIAIMGVLVYELHHFLDRNFGSWTLPDDQIVYQLKLEVGKKLSLADIAGQGDDGVSPESLCILFPGHEITEVLSPKTKLELIDSGKIGPQQIDENSWVIVRRFGSREIVSRVRTVDIGWSAEDTICTADVSREIEVINTTETRTGFRLVMK